MVLLDRCSYYSVLTEVDESMTLHLCHPPVAQPVFYHSLRDGTVGCCVTPRGYATCACGRYALCDPLHHACGPACACACHRAERATDE
jgi:hypothetical protein